jgi:hypothetical protein
MSKLIQKLNLKELIDLKKLACFKLRIYQNDHHAVPQVVP